MNKTDQKIGVLIFSDWFLPGYKAGGPVTSVANLVRAMSKDFAFHIITRDTDYQESKPYLEIASGKWISNDFCEQIFYIEQGKLSRKALVQAINQVDCTVWYINGVYSWYFSILPLIIARKYKPEKIILAPRGMLSQQGVGVKTLKKKVFLFITRLIRLYNGVIFQATTESEKEDILSIFPRNSVQVAGNLLKKPTDKTTLEIVKKRGDVRFVSIARIAPEKNTLGALKYLRSWCESSFYDQDATVRYDIFGQIYNQEYWTQCQNLIDQMPGNITVSFNGPVPPESIQSALADSHFLLLPTTGENFGHSIVESFVSGRPVLISDRTPWRNLENLQAGWDVSLSDSDGFVRIIDQCVQMEQPVFNEMSLAAMDYAKQISDSNSTIGTYKKLFTR